MREGDSDSKNSQVNKNIPPGPIKTYQWEEVRRSRRKGGYPWTHLDKPSYREGKESISIMDKIKAKTKRFRQPKKTEITPDEPPVPSESTEPEVIIIRLRDDDVDTEDLKEKREDVLDTGKTSDKSEESDKEQIIDVDINAAEQLDRFKEKNIDEPPGEEDQQVEVDSKCSEAKDAELPSDELKVVDSSKDECDRLSNASQKEIINVKETTPILQDVVKPDISNVETGTSGSKEQKDDSFMCKIKEKTKLFKKPKKTEVKTVQPIEVSKSTEPDVIIIKLKDDGEEDVHKETQEEVATDVEKNVADFPKEPSTTETNTLDDSDNKSISKSVELPVKDESLIGKIKEKTKIFKKQKKVEPKPMEIAKPMDTTEPDIIIIRLKDDNEKAVEEEISETIKRDEPDTDTHDDISEQVKTATSGHDEEVDDGLTDKIKGKTKIITKPKMRYDDVPSAAETGVVGSAETDLPDEGIEADHQQEEIIKGETIQDIVAGASSNENIKESKQIVVPDKEKSKSKTSLSREGKEGFFSKIKEKTKMFIKPKKAEIKEPEQIKTKPLKTTEPDVVIIRLKDDDVDEPPENEMLNQDITTEVQDNTIDNIAEPENITLMTEEPAGAGDKDADDVATNTLEGKRRKRPKSKVPYDYIPPETEQSSATSEAVVLDAKVDVCDDLNKLPVDESKDNVDIGSVKPDEILAEKVGTKEADDDLTDTLKGVRRRRPKSKISYDYVPPVSEVSETIAEPKAAEITEIKKKPLDVDDNSTDELKGVRKGRPKSKVPYDYIPPEVETSKPVVETEAAEATENKEENLETKPDEAVIDDIDNEDDIPDIIPDQAMLEHEQEDIREYLKEILTLTPEEKAALDAIGEKPKEDGFFSKMKEKTKIFRKSKKVKPEPKTPEAIKPTTPVKSTEPDFVIIKLKDDDDDSRPSELVKEEIPKRDEMDDQLADAPDKAVEQEPIIVEGVDTVACTDTDADNLTDTLKGRRRKLKKASVPYDYVPSEAEKTADTSKTDETTMQVNPEEPETVLTHEEIEKDIQIENSHKLDDKGQLLIAEETKPSSEVAEDTTKESSVSNKELDKIKPQQNKDDGFFSKIKEKSKMFRKPKKVDAKPTEVTKPQTSKSVEPDVVIIRLRDDYDDNEASSFKEDRADSTHDTTEDDRLLPTKETAAEEVKSEDAAIETVAEKNIATTVPTFKEKEINEEIGDRGLKRPSDSGVQEESIMDKIKEKTKRFRKPKITETKPVESIKVIETKTDEPNFVIIKLKDEEADAETENVVQDIDTEEIFAKMTPDKRSIDASDDADNKSFDAPDEPEEMSTSDNISQYLDQDEPPDAPQTISTTSDVKPSTSSTNDSQKKRKLSAESKISFKKLDVMKKLRETKDKIKIPTFTMPKFQIKKKSDLKKATKSKKDKPKSGSIKAKGIEEKKTREKSDSPKYIFIPLKTPPSEPKTLHLRLPMDLDDEDVGEVAETAPEIIEIAPVVVTGDVVIIPVELTEDMGKCVKEEPIESELLVTQPTANRLVPFVDEEDGLKLSSTAIALINEELAKESLPEISEETELKSSLKSEISPPSPIIKKKVSFKKRPSSKASEESRIYESFDIPKDVSPSPKPEDDSESTSKEDTVIESTMKTENDKKDPKKDNVLKTSQSMSVDEEKSYLDKQIIKTTSLEDDYNKWSKLSDHEYEPINPPGLESSQPQGPQTIHDIESTEELHRASGSLASSTTSLDRKQLRVALDDEVTVPGDGEIEDKAMAGKHLGDVNSSQDLESKQDDHIFRGTPETTGSRTDGEFNTSRYNSSILEDLPLHKDSRKKATLAQAEGSQGSNIQQALRNHAGKLKTRLKGIKKPTFNMPSRPKFERPKFQRPKFERPKFDRPKFSMPKMPDRPKINFPSFTFPRRGNTKSSVRELPSSTESTAGGSKKPFFEFRTTYPRIFDRLKKSKEAPDVSKRIRKPTPPPEFATVPRVSRKKGPVGARWVHRFTDIKFADDDSKKSRDLGSEESPNVESLSSKDREDSLERRMAADARYNEALAMDEEYDRENREIHQVSPYNEDVSKRWSHGSFHAAAADADDEEEMERRYHRNGKMHTSIELPTSDAQRYTRDSTQSVHTNQEERSSGSSSDRHRRGVLEEIDDDEFFLRQKGISQDNIEVGAYLSSEIREAFRTPVNSLSQMNQQNRYYEHEYDLDVSDQSGLPPETPKRRGIKKPKRVKKTPHASHEEMSYDQDSIITEPEEYPKSYSSYTTPPPSRPTRSRKAKKDQGPTVVPYQETIQVEEQFSTIPTNGDAEEEQEEEPTSEYLSRYYENEHMKDINQPEIFVVDDRHSDFNSNRYDSYQQGDDVSEDQAEFEQSPIAPKRKNKSLRSLVSEPDSIFDEIHPKRELFGEIPLQEISAYRAERDFIIPAERPIAPKRSRTRSPRSRTVSAGDEDRTSRGADSLASDSQLPCEEPECVLDVRDAMGYAVIDKQKQREPPLPPSSRPSIPKRRRSTKSTSSAKSGETKFFTVPRPLNDTSPPVRPLRNYSTLGPSRPPRRSIPNLTDEEKENVDITQYIEIIDDEPSRNLQSGEVIQKMRDRPLPAPPRPPRKTRDVTKDTFRDITHESNIIMTSRSDNKLEISPTSTNEIVDEIEVSTQTDPLPDDFTCEEVAVEPNDDVVVPTRRKRGSRSSSRFGSKSSISRKRRDGSKTPDRSKTPDITGTEEIMIEKRDPTPTHFEHEETITHGTLIVQPITDDSQPLPHSYVAQRFGTEMQQISDLFSSPQLIKDLISERFSESEVERQIVIEKDFDEEESSEVPEEFKLLRDPSPLRTTKDEDDYSEIPEEFKQLRDPPKETTVDSEQRLEEVQEAPISVPTRKKRQVDKEVEDDYSEIPEDFAHRRSPPVETPVRTKRKSDKKSDDVETTEIPIDFHHLRDPPPIAQLLASQTVQEQHQQPQPHIIERIIERQVPVPVMHGSETEVDLLKTQRLQVGDLDVERLNVSQLQAQKIIVADIEGGSLQVNDISSKSGNLIVGGIEFPPNLINDLLEKLQAAVIAQVPLQQQPPPPPHEVQTVTRQTSTDCPSIFDEPSSVSTVKKQALVENESAVDTVEIIENIEKPECSTSAIPEESVKKVDPKDTPSVSQSDTPACDENRFQDYSQIESATTYETEEEDYEMLNEKDRLKKNLDEKFVDDIIALAREIVENSLDIDESVLESMRPIADDVREEEIIGSAEEDSFGRFTIEEEYLLARDIAAQQAGRFREHAIHFEQMTPKSSESEEIPHLIEIHSMQFTRSEDKEEVPPELPPKQRKTTQAQKSSESEPAPERPQLPVYHSIPYPTSVYPEYIPSVPPPSFYSLRARQNELSEDETPIPPRRRRHHRAVSKSSSEDIHPVSRRHTTRSPELTIPQLSSQLVRSCVNSMDRSLKELISHITTNVLGNVDGKQDLHVVMIILLVLIAGLILLGFGGDKTIHLHHWEYFNPPRDL